MSKHRSSRSVRRERPEDAQAGGAATAPTSGRKSGTSLCRSSTPTRRAVSRTARSWSSSTRSSPLRTPTSIPSARTSDAGTVREELEEVAAGQDAQDLPRLLDQDGGTVLERLERELDRRVELDQADRRTHDLRDIGLQGIGVAEDAVQERILVHAADELRDVDAVLADHGGLRDVELVQDVDRLADLVASVDRDERRDVPVLGG